MKAGGFDRALAAHPACGHIERRNARHDCLMNDAQSYWLIFGYQQFRFKLWFFRSRRAPAASRCGGRSKLLISAGFPRPAPQRARPSSSSLGNGSASGREHWPEGENNLHSRKGVDGFWFVLSGGVTLWQAAPSAEAAGARRTGAPPQYPYEKCAFGLQKWAQTPFRRLAKGGAVV
jgi:hypothetical protein